MPEPDDVRWSPNRWKMPTKQCQHFCGCRRLIGRFPIAVSELCGKAFRMGMVLILAPNANFASEDFGL
jgi:hypothetical protein